MQADALSKTDGVAFTPDMHLQMADDATLLIPAPDGYVRRLHPVWLRDNCACGDCRVQQSGERRIFTAGIADGLTVEDATLGDDGVVQILFSDGHRSWFTPDWLAAHDYSMPVRRSLRPIPSLWDHSLVDMLPRIPWADICNSAEGELAYCDSMAELGLAIVTGVPSVPGEVERFAELVGHVREVAFERVHNVAHDPHGYNVAHTPLELKPHTDLPSYRWPPSVQLLHFLVNQASGGETVLVDGWRVLADLRAEDPKAFALLTTVELSFQLFSDTEDTFATAPLVQLHPDGTVALLRFSNQLAQPLNAAVDVIMPFYAAYQRLGRMMEDPQYRLVFKADDGDLVSVHGHRVLHGRLPFDPASGARHLQDVYMEFDDLMARRRVLRGVHRPVSAMPAIG